MALSTLNDQCVYNGYGFSANMQTLSLHGEYQYDDAGRTVIYTKWTITIRDRVSPFVFSIASLTSAAGTATVTTSSPHLLHTDDTVTISGASPSNYNGTFA